ncbi:MAG: FtsQ-type POTRA domain-containing protein [Cyanobacteria bacterium SBC]|nr:FtsQ-type POTRA domain-containing protein [Cyanobacteria bacterium SBC]
MTANPLFSGISSRDLIDRRKHLRRQRGLKRFRGSCRFLAVAAVACSVVWGVSQQDWTIRQADQIRIDGNHWLSDDVLRSLIPVSYPESLLHLDPQAISQTLKTQAPIADATVRRHLIPPRLVVQVRERHPVAVAYLVEPHSGTARPGDRVGLLDANGVWMPLENYEILDRLQLPALRVLGSIDRYQNEWPQAYRFLERSPVAISEIDWRDPSNIMVTTRDLGIVHLGSFDGRFKAQIQALDRLRNLPQTVNLSQVAYIDLRDPDAPLLQMTNPQNALESYEFASDWESID